MDYHSSARTIMNVELSIYMRIAERLVRTSDRQHKEVISFWYHTSSFQCLSHINAAAQAKVLTSEKRFLLKIRKKVTEINSFVVLTYKTNLPSTKKKKKTIEDERYNLKIVEVADCYIRKCTNKGRKTRDITNLQIITIKICRAERK